MLQRGLVWTCKSAGKEDGTKKDETRTVWKREARARCRFYFANPGQSQVTWGQGWVEGALSPRALLHSQPSCFLLVLLLSWTQGSSRCRKGLPPLLAHPGMPELCLPVY